MKNTMEYKGYVGSIEYSDEDNILFGKVQGIRSLILYEGTTVNELLDDFHDAVDDYLDLCEKKGVMPEKAYKGTFNVRISSDLHKEAAVFACNNNKSLNYVMEESLRYFLKQKKG